ncbi:hypothetical protein [Thalassoroseus pseudoceratinae]|uniref:hypothetical protein n=1 Tax=Thalassoroseus pseudoceratinae TaxID=2713176 RepID=UPI00141DAD58|nr:hypothetical protein [Thalassoroseus pseudoceratinae]
MRSINLASAALAFGFCLPVFADEPTSDDPLNNLFAPAVEITPSTQPEVPTPPTDDPLDALFGPQPVQPSSKPATKPVSKDEDVPKAELLRRIEQLERRLAEVEAKQSQPPKHTSPTPDPAPYSVKPQSTPLLQNPVAPPKRSVPPNWKKFHFNGEDYYYIPVKDVSPTRPSY